MNQGRVLRSAFIIADGSSSPGATLRLDRPPKDMVRPAIALPISPSSAGLLKLRLERSLRIERSLSPHRRGTIRKERCDLSSPRPIVRALTAAAVVVMEAGRRRGAQADAPIRGRSFRRDAEGPPNCDLALRTSGELRISPPKFGLLRACWYGRSETPQCWRARCVSTRTHTPDTHERHLSGLCAV